MKTAIEITAAIRDLCSAGLPALLAAALPDALPDFAQYLNTPPKKDDDSELCVYVDSEIDSTLVRKFTAIIQCQIYKTGKDLSQDYHSVIFPFLKKNLIPDLAGFEIRDFLEADIWPMDERSTTFIYYAVGFTEDLDDCYDD